MASAYAIPSSPGPHSHDQTYSRQLANSKLPLRPPSMNTGHFYNEQSAGSNGLVPDSLEDSPPTAVEAFPHMNAHHPEGSFLQLPKPPSFSTPVDTRFKSMERRKSAGLPTHLNLQGTGYGFSPSAANKVQLPDSAIRHATFTLEDGVNSLFLSVPFVLASLTFGFGMKPSASSEVSSAVLETSYAEDEANTGLKSSQDVSAFVVILGMTGASLAVFGLAAKLTQYLRSGMAASGLNESLKQRSLVSLCTVQKLASQILSVGIPFGATYCLGGVRVATILLPAAASGLLSTVRPSMNLKQWARFADSRKYSLVMILVQSLSDLAGLSSDLSAVRIVIGYILTTVSIFALPPPYPHFHASTSDVSAGISAASDTKSHTSEMEGKHNHQGSKSSLRRTPEDVDLALISAGILWTLAYMLNILHSTSAGATLHWKPFWCLLSSLAFGLSLKFASIRSLQKSRGLGTAIGSLASCCLAATLSSNGWMPLVYQFSITGASYVALLVDFATAAPSSSDSARNVSKFHRHTRSRPSEVPGASKFTNFLLPRVLGWPLLHTILVEKDSRRIFYFMCLNFAFMLVQTFYGIVSGSLGLLSDSIHMFFDCLALVVGLSAAVMSKWPPSTRFPYGYAKIETLAGFANGIFLMLISVEIIYEAVERLSEGSNVKRLNELMTVSILGFVINIIGVLAFGHAHHGHDHSHGHSHTHHEHSHKHEHTHHEHSHEHYDHEYSDQHHDHEHSQGHHDHGHDHAHSQLGHSHEHDHHHHHQYERKDEQANRRDHCQDRGKTQQPDLKPHAQFAQLNGFAGTENLSVPSPTPSMYASVPATPSKPSYLPQSSSHSVAGHGHDHHHKHGHSHHHSENMMGIYLHVIGDTLGSLAVVLSTWLVQWNGWSGWDPLASTGIAIIIFGTAIPLVRSCASKLLLTVPDDVEYDLREALAGLSSLRGVIGCTVPKFWVQEGEERQVMGVVHVMADKVSNLDDVKERCIAFLKSAGLDVLVQVEREGMSRCWCQASR